MSKGCDFLKKSFTVPIQVNVSQERWDNIFAYCKCPESAIEGLLNKNKELQCSICGKPIKRTIDTASPYGMKEIDE